MKSTTIYNCIVVCSILNANDLLITALLTGLGDKYEIMVETFDNLDDYTLQQVKVKLTSTEERVNKAKAVADARARKNTQPNAESGPQQQEPHGENAFFAQGSKKRRYGGAGAANDTKRRRTKIQCWNCGKWGHYERECTAAKKEDNS
ncbi:hypothetical protein PHMEG_00029295 [Phytophthora megakarya]|uniref:CCHC-type domain-containing protein n=1 Tax=Phytophthora megakarya TaxID=4795 RepID=A0A225V3X0_9STRA|nr:hypothetical protein PHMEG_00029295 [Phytophthora megakarya]